MLLCLMFAFGSDTVHASAAPSAEVIGDAVILGRLDADPAARYVPLPISGTTASAPQRDRIRRIERALHRNPDEPSLLAARGFIRYQRGEVDAAEADFARALQTVGENRLLRRHVLWSQGWGRFEAGRDEAALAAWRESVALHGGRPFWWPYTAALAEWRLGRRDTSIALYDEAVRGMPEWGTEIGLSVRTRYWPAEQFDVASEIFLAWNASPRS